MKHCYLALLRGINVGGNNMIKMAELKDCLEKSGLTEVRTYIQSGNLLFCSDKTDGVLLAVKVKSAIAKRFGINVEVAIFSKEEWRTVLKNAPEDWGKDATWKHNLFVMLKPYDMKQVEKSIGELKPGIETLKIGEGVLYQSVSIKMYGRTTTGKIASSPLYKQMTVRNYNTSLKLLELLNESDS